MRMGKDGDAIMIDVKRAISAATGFIDEVYANENLSSVRLEEVELADQSDPGVGWYVTLSFIRPKDALAGITGAGAREYKTISVSPVGEVRGMKMKSLA